VDPDAYGQLAVDDTTFASKTFVYDAAGRLITADDFGFDTSGCVTRTYSFAGTAGKATNRTSMTTHEPGPSGECQTTTGTTRSYDYDTADRVTTAGTVYDALGRTLTTPAVDTLQPANGDATMTYHTNDMVRTIAQNGRTATYTLDVIANRFRSWIDGPAGGALTKTHHYTNDGNSHAWTNEGDGNWTRPIIGLAGLAAIQVGPAAGITMFQVTNLHGDIVAVIPTGSPVPAHTTDYSEFGTPDNPSDIGARRYGWLGSHVRPADTPDGSTLMGARIYNAATGRFRSTDPFYNGSANAYEYCAADPVNCADTDGNYCRRVNVKKKFKWPDGLSLTYTVKCKFPNWLVRAAQWLLVAQGLFLGAVAAMLTPIALPAAILFAGLGTVSATLAGFIGVIYDDHCRPRGVKLSFRVRSVVGRAFKITHISWRCVRYN
jgi:RHS repeat-associated protein